MAVHPPALQALIQALNRLPGVGPRSAERHALFLVQADAIIAQQLSRALVEAREKVQPCRTCGCLTESQPCAICADDRRDQRIVCVVERPTDIFPIEKSGVFHGRYHVLGGHISPINGVGPEDLRITDLEARLKGSGVEEVVLALGTDVEGDATSYYLAKRLGNLGRKISRLAYGLPAGSALDTADEVTLSRAMEGRRSMDSP